jgi:hypothetical protein
MRRLPDDDDARGSRTRSHACSDRAGIASRRCHHRPREFVGCYVGKSIASDSNGRGTGHNLRTHRPRSGHRRIGSPPQPGTAGYDLDGFRTTPYRAVVGFRITFSPCTAYLLRRITWFFAALAGRTPEAIFREKSADDDHTPVIPNRPTCRRNRAVRPISVPAGPAESVQAFDQCRQTQSDELPAESRRRESPLAKIGEAEAARAARVKSEPQPANAAMTMTRHQQGRRRRAASDVGKPMPTIGQAAAGSVAMPGQVLADAGYCSVDNLDRAASYAAEQ